MSTIEEVRAAETRVQNALDALRKVDARDPSHLGDELKNATDEYGRSDSWIKFKVAPLPGQ